MTEKNLPAASGRHPEVQRVEVLLSREAVSALRVAAEGGNGRLPAKVRKRLEKRAKPKDRSKMTASDRRGLSSLERSGEFVCVALDEGLVQSALSESAADRSESLRLIAEACDAAWTKADSRLPLEAGPVRTRREPDSDRLRSIVRGGLPQ